MGSSRAEVLAEFGKPSQGNESTLMYPSRGIAFYLAGDTVSTVQGFAPMKYVLPPRSLGGMDRLLPVIVAKVLVQDIRIQR